MKKLRNKLNLAVLKGQMAMRDFLSNERGDTNFISIAIILIIVIAIAVTFISMGGQISEKFKTEEETLMSALGSH